MTAAEPAKDRAWDVVDDVLAQYDQLIGDPAGRIVAALMADPALLVDLAIEAGALVALSDTFAWKPDPDFDGAAIVNFDGPNGRGGDNWHPLYRRTTQENAS